MASMPSAVTSLPVAVIIFKTLIEHQSKRKAKPSESQIAMVICDKLEKDSLKRRI